MASELCATTTKRCHASLPFDNNNNSEAEWWHTVCFIYLGMFGLQSERTNPKQSMHIRNQLSVTRD
jgi:hypothetical protein